MTLIFIQAIIAGLFVAAPLGPIALLCMQRTLRSGFSSGFVTGLGAASADMLLGSLGLLGMATLTSTAEVFDRPFKLFSAIILCELGFRTMTTSPSKHSQASHSSRLLFDFTTTFLLTMTNPPTLILFSSLAFSLTAEHSAYQQGPFIFPIIAGLFLGSLTWWLFLTGLLSLSRYRINETAQLWINKISGLALILFGGFHLLKAM